MRLLGLTALALTTALVTSAAAQQGATLSVVPSGPMGPQGGQEYMLILVPRTGQPAQSATGITGQPGYGQTGAGLSQAASDRSQANQDVENFVRQVYERGYLQGRLAERQSGGAQLSQSELERLGRQLFVRGYVQGRYEESMDSDRGRQQEAIGAAQQAVKEARQALRAGDYREARRAMRRADQALPDDAASGMNMSQSGTDMSQAGARTGSVRSRSGSQPGDMPGINDTLRGAEPNIADRIAPGTVTGRLPIPIPEAQPNNSSGSNQ